MWQGRKRAIHSLPVLPFLLSAAGLLPALIRAGNAEPDPLGDLSLDHMQAYRKINMRAQQDHKHGQAPQKLLQRLDDINDTGHERTFRGAYCFYVYESCRPDMNASFSRRIFTSMGFERKSFIPLSIALSRSSLNVLAVQAKIGMFFCIRPV